MGLLFNNASVTRIRNQTRWHTEMRVNSPAGGAGGAKRGGEREKGGKKIMRYRIDEIIDITGSLARLYKHRVSNASFSDASRAPVLTRV